MITIALGIILAVIILSVFSSIGTGLQNKANKKYVNDSYKWQREAEKKAELAMEQLHKKNYNRL